MIERRRTNRRQQMRRTCARHTYDVHLEVKRGFFSFRSMSVKKAKVIRRENRRSGIDRRVLIAAMNLTD